MLTRTFFARAPLAPGRFAPLPVGAITAQGALRDKLLALRAGLLSRCASCFPEAGEQSAWYGGALGGGMHAPDLLEAMLRTSALLGDAELRREALHLCECMVATQREDGAFGAPGESFAARGRMLRAVTAAYSLTGDKHLLSFLLRYMKYLHDTLRTTPLSARDALHTADTLEAGIFLYNVTGQRAILSVLMMLVSQGADYTSLFHAFPYRTPVSRAHSVESLREALAHEDDAGYAHHLLRTADGANLCQGLRASALCGVLTGSGKHISAAEAGLTRLNKAHGAACGGITADPLLAGTHPSRGVSAISACELAASLETLLACPGELTGVDQLETLLYNGIDAAFSADGQAVQPIQQANQALLSAYPRFPLSAPEANLFSLADGDALCALLGAWPRFAGHQWMLSRDGGLCAMGYAPCEVRYRLDGAAVCVAVESTYPASGQVRITLHVDKETAFPLHLRIPAWAQGASAAIDGEIVPAQPGALLTLNRQWHDGDEILLTLPMNVVKTPCFHQAVSLARGPLRFAYALPTSDGLRASDGFAVALVGGVEPEVIQTKLGIRLRALVVPAPRWGMRQGSCDQPPITLGDLDAASAFEAMLVPYAESALRLAVLPVI